MSSRVGLLAVAVAAAVSIFGGLTTPALARWWDYPHAGYCPPGTCNGIGGWRALNVRNCRAANCSRHR